MRAAGGAINATVNARRVKSYLRPPNAPDHSGTTGALTQIEKWNDLMPEGRMLKKVISESKSLGNLKSDSARLLYSWLIPFLDIEGRHSADPDILKGHIFPKVKSMRVGKIARLLQDLAIAGLIVLYRKNEEIYLQLINFQEHQKLDRDREAPSKIPAPTEDSIITPEDSRPTHENSLLSKGNISLSKDNISKTIGQPQTDEFDLFWEAYPKHVHKQDALKAFVALRKKDSLENIAQATNGYNAYLKKQGIEDPKYVLHPATFLRSEKYKDYIGVEYKPPL